ncbi:MAG: hypothetical protein IJO93_05785 [Clostridia bacterium]|nr:hypothetical protein [Clostridia bacterium]
MSSTKTKNLDWIKVDNAGKIYPASRRSNWTAMFRVSVTLKDEIDATVLEKAKEITFRRFPTMAVRLKAGLFWYYLQHMDSTPALQQDVQNPCVRMNLKENDGFMIRIRYFHKTIAAEFFHILTDGTGGMSFLLTLAAEYIRIKYGEKIPRDGTILDCTRDFEENEIEDAFLKYARYEYLSRKEPDSFHIKGTQESPENIHTVTGILNVSQALAKAKECGVSLTEYLAAVTVKAISNIQERESCGKLRPVKVGVPVSLRRFYPDTNTKRNFASYVNVGIEPRLGNYEIAEIAEIVHCQMQLENTEKMMNAKFSTNVRSERNMLLRIVPLFIKNIAMKAVFESVGDRKTATTFSNLGRPNIPMEMARHIDRLDFLVGPLSKNKVVIGTVTYGEKLYINFVRTIRESKLEKEFFTLLVKEGVHVLIDSNNIYEEEI